MEIIILVLGGVIEGVYTDEGEELTVLVADLDVYEAGEVDVVPLAALPRKASTLLWEADYGQG